MAAAVVAKMTAAIAARMLEEAVMVMATATATAAVMAAAESVQVRSRDMAAVFIIYMTLETNK